MSLLDTLKNLTPYFAKAPIELGNVLNSLMNVDTAKSPADRQTAYNKLTQIQPVMMNQNQAADIFQSPLKSALKTGLSAGSFMLPGVGGSSKLLGTLAKGTVSGGMGGYSEAQPGKEGLGAVMGAGLGLGASGLTYGGSRLLSKLGTKAGQKAISKTGLLTEGTISDQAVRNIGFTSKNMQDIGGWNSAKKAAATFYNKAAQSGLDTSERYARSEAASNLVNLANNDVGDFIASHPNALVDISGIKSSISKSPVLQLMGADDSNTAQAINKLITSTGTKVDLATANKLKGYLDSAAGGFSKGIQGEQSAASNAVLKQARDTIRKAMSESLQGQERTTLDTLLSDESSLIRVLKATSGNTAKVAPVKLPLGMSISGTGATKATDKLANIAAGKPGVTKTAPIATGLSNILAGGSAVAEKAAPFAGAVSSTLTGQEAQQETTQLPEGISYPEGFSVDPMTGYLKTPSMTTETTAGTTTQGTDFVSALSQAQQLLPGGSASEILSYAKAIMDASTPTTSGGQAAGKLNAVISSVNQAESLLDSGAKPGIGKGFTTGIANVLGTASELDTQYQSAIAGVNTTLATLLTGTAQTETETRKLKNMIISGSDSEKAVRAKLQLIKSYVTAYSGQ